MRQMDDIPEQLKMMVALEGETIHMNVLAASSLVMEAIIEYKKKHEDINFQLHQNSESELYDIAVTTKLFYQGGNEKNSFACGEGKKFYLLSGSGGGRICQSSWLQGVPLYLRPVLSACGVYA